MFDYAREHAGDDVIGEISARHSRPGAIHLRRGSAWRRRRRGSRPSAKPTGARPPRRRSKAPASRALISRAADGVALQPLYPRREGPARAARRRRRWRALARLDHPDPAAANEQALDDLANGADGLQVVFAGAAGAYGFGLAKFDSAALHRAFEGVRFDAAQPLRTRSRP